MAKTEAYSWPMSPRLKNALEEAARAERNRSRDQGQEDGEEERLRAAVMQFVGTIESGQSERAENARSEVQARIARRHDR